MPAANRPHEARIGAYEASSLDPYFASGDLVVKSAKGCWLIDVNGRRVFDASGGSGAVNLGHGHPSVVAACHAQLEKVVHTGWNIATDTRQIASRKLAEFVPIHDASILFCVTGAEAIEAAIKVAFTATGRRWIVAFRHGYHGKTAGALSVTWRDDFRRYSPVDDRKTVFCDLPDEGAAEQGVAHVADVIERKRPTLGAPAAILIEPIQGAEGVYPAGASFLRGLRALADRLGALLIFDEIYTGFGRTGEKFVAGSDAGLPHILVLGKALGNGLPISAVIGSRALMEALPPGAHTSTFAAHPLACAAAVAVLDEMTAIEPWHMAALIGNQLRDSLADLAARRPRLGAPRGCGLMLAFDCLDHSRSPDPGLASQFIRTARQAGLLLRGGGRSAATVKITPPLIMEDGEADFLLNTMATVAEKVMVPS